MAQTNPAIPNISALTAGVTAAQTAWARQSHAYLRAYGNLLEVYDEIAHSWLDRQRAGIDSAISAAERISRTSDPQETIRIYNEWFIENLKRLTDDIVKIGEQIAAAPSKAISALQSEAEEEAKQIKIAGTEGAPPSAAGGERHQAG